MSSSESLEGEDTGYARGPTYDSAEEIGALTGHKRRKGSNSSDDDSFYDVEAIMKDPQLRKKEKLRIWKNLLLICVAFVGNFTAFNGASVLQSSLNADAGLGTASLAVIYGSLILSAMFLPTYVIKFLGCKWTLVVAICCYVTYPLANFYPHFGTLIPSSIFVGLGAAPLWSAKCAYLTTAAKRYARLTGETVDAVVNRFFGVFFLFFQSTFIIGNLISSFVLSSGEAQNLEFPSCFEEEYIKNYCGKNDCQKDLDEGRLKFNSSNCPVTNIESGDVPDWTIYLLMGIYAGVGICGALVMAFLVDNVKIRNKETRGPFDLLIATFKHMKDKRQLMLIPITMYSGFEQAFLTGDYTRSFITCPLAVNWVGFVLICYGACDSIFSFSFGRVEKYTGRWPLFTLAFLINIALIIVFQIWIPYPYPSAAPLFFILVALWGMADAVWQTQLNALYGVLFVSNQEASFANYRLWESLGFVITFAYQSFICVSVKIYIMLAVLILGMALYYYVEFQEHHRTNKVSSRRGSASSFSNTPEKRTANNEAFMESNSSGLGSQRITSM